MFKVTPKEDFSNFKTGTTYLVLSETPVFINSQLKLLVHDDNMDIDLMPANKFRLVLENPTPKVLQEKELYEKKSSLDPTSSGGKLPLTPQQKAAITRRKNKEAQENNSQA